MSGSAAVGRRVRQAESVNPGEWEEGEDAFHNKSFWGCAEGALRSWN